MTLKLTQKEVDSILTALTGWADLIKFNSELFIENDKNMISPNKFGDVVLKYNEFLEIYQKVLIAFNDNSNLEKDDVAALVVLKCCKVDSKYKKQG